MCHDTVFFFFCFAGDEIHRGQTCLKTTSIPQNSFSNCLFIYLSSVKPAGHLHICTSGTQRFHLTTRMSLDGFLYTTQFETLAGFSAVIDRLGEFMEVIDEAAPASSAEDPHQDHSEPLLASGSTIQLMDEWHEGKSCFQATQDLTYGSGRACVFSIEQKELCSAAEVNEH